MVYPYVFGICNLAPIITDQFSLDIVPELWNAVTENLVKSPDWNVRNFTKDNIETILIKFPKFMEIFFSEKFIK